MNINKNNFVAIVLFIICSFIFFSKLFIPNLSIFFTPDLGRSDIIHYMYAKRFLLKESLQQFQLPLWSEKIGTGVSLIGEGQIGTFNLINVLLFYFLPLNWAFNLTYVIYLFLSLVGTFFLAKYIKLSSYAAFLTALAFSLSGFFIFRLSHTVVFAAAAFLPLIFLFGLSAIQSTSLLNKLLFILMISQAIFAGHQQIVFIALIGINLIVIYLLFHEHSLSKKTRINKFLLLNFLILAGLMLSACQLLPQFEHNLIAVRQKGLSFQEATENSLNPKLLLNLIYPYVFGSPQNASYPLLVNGVWDIFWEKNCYLGIIPLLLAVLAIFIKEKDKFLYQKVFIFLLIISLLLALGKYSPLFFLYLLPPLKFFHAPARFILLMTFALSVLAGMGMEKLLNIFKQKQWDTLNILFVKVIFILLIFIPNFLIVFNYHPLVGIDEVLKEPQSVKYIDKNARVAQLGVGFPYLQLLLTQGWHDISYYLFALNSLDANINVVYNISQTSVYDSILTNRQQEFQSILQNEVVGDFSNLTATASSVYKNLLNITNTKYIISPFKIIDQNLILKQTIKSEQKSFLPFYIYENTTVLPRIRLLSNYQKAVNEQQAFQQLTKTDFDPKNYVILENYNLPLKNFASLQNSNIQILLNTDQKVIIKTKSDSDSILVLADSYYPGWLAFIDDQSTTIYPANVNQRAIFLPQGNHQVSFTYQPTSLHIGLIISGIGYLLWLLLFFKNLAKIRT